MRDPSEVIAAVVACHRTVTPNGAWQWMDGPPSLGALDNLKVHPAWRIEYAYTTPQPASADVVACHAIVSDECRNNRSNLGAVNEAIGRLLDSATDLMEAWPIGKGAKLHFKLSVEYPKTAIKGATHA